MEDAPIKINPEGGVSSSSNPVEKTAQYLPLALKAIEENFAVSFSLIAVVGYIVIAAFGKMDTLKKYIGYLLFLTLSVCVYKLATTKVPKLTWVLIIAVGLLMGFILNERGFFVWVVSRLK